MLVASAMLGVLLVALCLSIRPKDHPMDRDVVQRIRRYADESRREQLLPYD